MKILNAQRGLKADKIKEHSTYKYEEVCNEEEVLDHAGHAALHGDEFVLLKGSP